MSEQNFFLGKPQQYPIDQTEADQWARMSFPKFQHSIASAIGSILVEQTGVSWDELSASTTFQQLNVWDDFDGSTFADAVEIRFNRLIPECDRVLIKTISDLVEYVSTWE